MVARYGKISSEEGGGAPLTMNSLKSPLKYDGRQTQSDTPERIIGEGGEVVGGGLIER